MPHGCGDSLSAKLKQCGPNDDPYFAYRGTLPIETTVIMQLGKSLGSIATLTSLYGAQCRCIFRNEAQYVHIPNRGTVRPRSIGRSQGMATEDGSRVTYRGAQLRCASVLYTLISADIGVSASKMPCLSCARRYLRGCGHCRRCFPGYKIPSCFAVIPSQFK